MSNQISTISNKDFFSSEEAKAKFAEVLGKKSTQFVTSLLSIIGNSKDLAKADSGSIYTAAMTAATMDLPINPNLGFAYILAYNGKDGCKAQFQMGYKGFIQLALRSGQFKTISVTEVYEGQVVEENPLKGYMFDFTKKSSEKIVGYASYFSLLNGFEKTLYMTTEQLHKHGVKFSQTFKKGFGLWKDDFDSMAKKTVLKLLLSKFAPLSTEMQMAVIKDQAIEKEDGETYYPDNGSNVINLDKIQDSEERKRLILVIGQCDTKEQLITSADLVVEKDDEEIQKAYDEKLQELSEVKE